MYALLISQHAPNEIMGVLGGFPPSSEASMSSWMQGATCQCQVDWNIMSQNVVDFVLFAYDSTLFSQVLTLIVPLFCSCCGSERTIFRWASCQGLLLQSRQVSGFGPRRAGLNSPWETTRTTTQGAHIISPHVHKPFLYFLNSSLCSDTCL